MLRTCVATIRMVAFAASFVSSLVASPSNSSVVSSSPIASSNRAACINPSAPAPSPSMLTPPAPAPRPSADCLLSTIRLMLNSGFFSCSANHDSMPSFASIASSSLRRKYSVSVPVPPFTSSSHSATTAACHRAHSSGSAICIHSCRVWILGFFSLNGPLHTKCIKVTSVSDMSAGATDHRHRPQTIAKPSSIADSNTSMVACRSRRLLVVLLPS